MGAGLFDDFVRNILFVPFSPYHFFRTILSNTILSLPLCVYHFVRYHFVLEQPITFDDSNNPEVLFILYYIYFVCVMKLNVVFSNYHCCLIKTDYNAEFSPEPMISFCKYLIGKSGDSE